ncbi:hypothetical protein Nepgr_003953 [Nepenthes gracilis]|uniref:Uncharacterized protein n=1 Tax=Nepenthes gracilis TaxID=150966 RepID=A0AAD3XEE3_NEPGR|nr:hypothetical protein Nepgr_003953 [Nepenthes gracilis]
MSKNVNSGAIPSAVNVSRVCLPDPTTGPREASTILRDHKIPDGFNNNAKTQDVAPHDTDTPCSTLLQDVNQPKLGDQEDFESDYPAANKISAVAHISAAAVSHSFLAAEPQSCPHDAPDPANPRGSLDGVRVGLEQDTSFALSPVSTSPCKGSLALGKKDSSHSASGIELLLGPCQPNPASDPVTDATSPWAPTLVDHLNGPDVVDIIQRSELPVRADVENAIFFNNIRLTRMECTNESGIQTTYAAAISSAKMLDLCPSGFCSHEDRGFSRDLAGAVYSTLVDETGWSRLLIGIVWAVVFLGSIDAASKASPLAEITLSIGFFIKACFSFGLPGLSLNMLLTSAFISSYWKAGGFVMDSIFVLVWDVIARGEPWLGWLHWQDAVRYAREGLVLSVVLMGVDGYGPFYVKLLGPRG